MLPLALGSVVDQTPGVHRSQLIQTDGATIRVRLEPEPADVERMWLDAASHLRTFFAQQGLGDVALVRAEEAPERQTTSGKFRQVIAAPRP